MEDNGAACEGREGLSNNTKADAGGKKRAVGMPCVRRKVRDPGAMGSEEWCTCKLKVWVFEAKGKLA